MSKDTQLITYNEEDLTFGMDEFDGDSVSMPMLRLLQSLSDECKKSNDKYIEGAEAGQFINRGTGELLGTSVDVIPLYYFQSYNKWEGKDTFRGVFLKSDPEVVAALKEDNRDGFKILGRDGCYYMETKNHYVAIVQDGDLSVALFPCSGSQIKRSKKWVSIMRMLKVTTADGTRKNPPMFTQIYTLTAEHVSANGNDWVEFSARHKSAVTDPVMQEEARELAYQARDQAAAVKVSGVNPTLENLTEEM
jgi:hypothetical protein